MSRELGKSGAGDIFKIALIPILIIINILFHLYYPTEQLYGITGAYAAVLTIFLGIYLVFSAVSIKKINIRKGILHKVPLFIAINIILFIWELLTYKLEILSLPYFPPLDKVLGVYLEDGSLILKSIYYSMKLLFTGYIIGAVIGLITGITSGWSARVYYWINPVIKVIGPIPATAWIPVSMIIFPTSFWAGVFLIALAVWFPVTVMTSSGITGVKNSYFEVAKTLGANERYLIFKVAIPAAYPNIFIGLFMGLGGSFVMLIVAEMLGVKAGLGWYITWAQGWAEYAKVYAALIVISVISSTLFTFLFKLRDKVLIWQRGLIKW